MWLPSSKTRLPFLGIVMSFLNILIYSITSKQQQQIKCVIKQLDASTRIETSFRSICPSRLIHTLASVRESPQTVHCVNYGLNQDVRSLRGAFVPQMSEYMLHYHIMCRTLLPVSTAEFYFIVGSGARLPNSCQKTVLKTG